MTSLLRINAVPLTQSAALPWPAAVYLLCVIVPICFYAGPLFLTLVRALLLILVLPLLFGLLRGRYGQFLWVDGLFLTFMLWATLALAMTSPAQVTTQMGSVGIEFLGGYLVARAYIRDQNSFIALCRWVVVLVLLSTPFAIYEAWTGRPLIVEIIRKIPALTSVEIVNIDRRMGLERVQFTFAHPIHYGLFCSVALSLCLVALSDVYATTKRLIFATIIMASGFLALSSGALLAIVLQLALIGWSLIFAGFQRRWWLLLGLFGLGYILVDLLSNRPPLRVFMSYATFSAHNAYWRGIIFDWGLKNLFGDAANNIPAAPWFGLGMHDWVRPSFMHSSSMDNFWLVTAIRYGVPGFLLLATGYSLAILQIMRRNFDADPALLLIRRAWVFTFLGLSFTLCTVFVWANIYSFVFFMFGAGVWLITAETGAPQLPVEQERRRKTIRYSRSFPHPVLAKGA